jgi:hypothetical protein
MNFFSICDISGDTVRNSGRKYLFESWDKKEYIRFFVLNISVPDMIMSGTEKKSNSVQWSGK